MIKIVKYPRLKYWALCFTGIPYLICIMSFKFTKISQVTSSTRKYVLIGIFLLASFNSIGAIIGRNKLFKIGLNGYPKDWMLLNMAGFEGVCVLGLVFGMFGYLIIISIFFILIGTLLKLWYMPVVNKYL